MFHVEHSGPLRIQPDLLFHVERKLFYMDFFAPDRITRRSVSGIGIAFVHHPILEILLLLPTRHFPQPHHNFSSRIKITSSK